MLRTLASLLMIGAIGVGASIAAGDAMAQQGPRRNVDASVGTRFDPLSKANRAFDLNTAKTVPKLR